MQFTKVPVRPNVGRLNRAVEHLVNGAVRGYHGVLSKAHLGGRKANYDDREYEFIGGPGDALRRKTYDKSLRLLWKAQAEAPWLGFSDASDLEQSLAAMAAKTMSSDERDAQARLSLPEYKALLNREYSRREKEAIVAVLAAIGHGEAYAWLTSAELLAEVKSTGARAALSMQVLEEAKHFVVLREIVRAFDVPPPRLNAFEYIFLESVLKAEGLEKLFGMNVVVEGIALSFFGIMSSMPGLEVLRLFHLDESRHTGLPANYFHEFPLTKWQRHNPLSRVRRLQMILPAIGLMPALEEDLAELGIDAFDFGGAVVRKIAHLAERNGFLLPVPIDTLLRGLDAAFNAYCTVTREGHERRDFIRAETTVGAAERAVEREIFGVG